jgi:hypothetical protein
MFRFTIRDLLCLTLMAAMGIGWFVVHQSVLKVKANLEQEKTKLQARTKLAEEVLESSTRIYDEYKDKFRPLAFPPKSKDL